MLVLCMERIPQRVAHAREHGTVRGGLTTPVTFVALTSSLCVQFLIGGVVVPLLVTLGINNKVAFLEKFGTSEFQNSTGAYELDLSLVNDFSRAWRTMHVKSDVFCSASIVLPDKGARQLNIGGWSDQSTMGIRLYTPDGSPGVNGTNDWEENWDELHLQVSYLSGTSQKLSSFNIGDDSGKDGTQALCY